MRYALDTNAVVAALNGVPPVPARLAALQATDVLLPAPVVAELYFGARASNRVRENVDRVDRLVALFGLQPFDEAAVRRFAEVKTELRRVGRAKSDFDLAIASIALVHGATLMNPARLDPVAGGRRTPRGHRRDGAGWRGGPLDDAARASGA